MHNIEFVRTNQTVNISDMGNPNLRLNRGMRGSMATPANRISKFNSGLASPLKLPPSIAEVKPQIRLPLSELIKRKVGHQGGEVDEKRIKAITLAAEKVAQRAGIEIEMPSAAFVPNRWQTDQTDPDRPTLEKAWAEDDVDLKEKILKIAKDEEVAHEIEAHNNSIVKGFNEWIRKKAIQMEEIRDGVKNTKLPPQIPNINIFREEENMFPLDFNMDMYNFNVQSRDNETKNISDNVKSKMLLPLKSCQLRLSEIRVDIGLKRKELKMLQKQHHDAIRDLEEKSSSSSQNSNSDYSAQKTNSPDQVAIAEEMLETCREQIRTLKEEAEWAKESIRKMKIGIIDMMKGWAHWEESAPENIFEFKLNDQLKYVTEEINSNIAKKARSLNQNIVKHKMAYEKDFDKHLKKIHEDYEVIEDAELYESEGGSSVRPGTQSSR